MQVFSMYAFLSDYLFLYIWHLYILYCNHRSEHAALGSYLFTFVTVNDQSTGRVSWICGFSYQSAFERVSGLWKPLVQPWPGERGLGRRDSGKPLLCWYVI